MIVAHVFQGMESNRVLDVQKDIYSGRFQTFDWPTACIFLIVGGTAARMKASYVEGWEQPTRKELSKPSFLFTKNQMSRRAHCGQAGREPEASSCAASSA